MVMASRGRRGSVPAREGEQRRDEPRREDQGEQQAPAPQAQVPVPEAQDHGGPSIMERFKRMSPPSFKGESDPLLAESWCADDDRVTLATYMLQEQADMWWSSLLHTRFEDGAMEIGWDEFRSVSSGGRDGVVLGGEEGFSEEACSSFPEAGEKEGGFSVTAASRAIGKQSGAVSIGSRIAPDYSREVSVEWPKPQQQQQQRQRQDDQGDLEPQLECLR
ncbi:hypothetical protein Taro_049619 [Colocasia esculenta]|uniref:Uncharacterized protein n=1 Tax=Colocasia esculenta TaxID=4460 RepID=A0A843XBI8_COLES|nr:hypothetical protein [Colocasia esculenta]